MSDELKYEMVGSDGKQYGPFTRSELQENVEQGRANSGTKVREVGAESWQLLGKVLNLNTPVSVMQSGSSEAAVPSDEPLNIGAAMSDGWALFKEHMGLMIGAGAIFFGILMAAGLLGAIIPAAQLLVQGPLMGGMILLTLKLSREGHAEIGDLFLGFKNFGWLLLTTVVQGALIFAAILPGIILIVIGALSLAAENEGMGVGLFIAGGAISFVMAMVVGVLINYAVFLVADQRGTFGEAFLSAYQGTKKNFWRILGLMILFSLVTVVGILPCGLGLLFTIPWTFAVMTKVYEQIFPLPAN
tara:strand:- start:111 stop:1013 length:903 start_codon:yes stop_codon:yes gene_type:complete